jgi:hypothetical protein
MSWWKSSIQDEDEEDDFGSRFKRSVGRNEVPSMSEERKQNSKYVILFIIDKLQEHRSQKTNSIIVWEGVGRSNFTWLNQ